MSKHAQHQVRSVDEHRRAVTDALRGLRARTETVPLADAPGQRQMEHLAEAGSHVTALAIKVGPGYQGEIENADCGVTCKRLEIWEPVP